MPVDRNRPFTTLADWSVIWSNARFFREIFRIYLHLHNRDAFCYWDGNIVLTFSCFLVAFYYANADNILIMVDTMLVC